MKHIFFADLPKAIHTLQDGNSIVFLFFISVYDFFKEAGSIFENLISNLFTSQLITWLEAFIKN